MIFSKQVRKRSDSATSERYVELQSFSHLFYFINKEIFTVISTLLYSHTKFFLQTVKILATIFP